MNKHRARAIVFIGLLCQVCNTDANLETIFTRTYVQNGWRDLESVSGSGSNLKQTRVIRGLLPKLISRLQVKKILDAPCGDFYWMSKIALPPIQYIGVDIVRELITKNKEHYGVTAHRIFLQRNIIRDVLPHADLIICRDCLVHLSFRDALAALRNFKKTGARYILTTTFTSRTTNLDTQSPLWRPLNLTKPPFNFPKPLLLINEACTEKNGIYTDKSLGLWRLSDVIS